MKAKLQEGELPDHSVTKLVNALKQIRKFQKKGLNKESERTDNRFEHSWTQYDDLRPKDLNFNSYQVTTGRNEHNDKLK